MKPRTELIVALDLPTLKAAESVLSALKGLPIVYKIGLELFSAEGPHAVEVIKSSGARVFLDLKLHDIPNTVESAVKSSVKLGADFLTVHALGGRQMLEAAVRGAQGSSLKLLAVTVLTSHSEESWTELTKAVSHRECAIASSAQSLAELAVDSGLTGLVCSPHEVRAMRAQFSTAFLVTPGIRPEGAQAQDQNRIMTPREAAAEGSSAIVVGRPILQAPSPRGVAESILKELMN